MKNLFIAANFVHEHETLSFDEKSAFYLTFARHELLGDGHRLDMANLSMDKRTLFDIFLYITVCFKGEVYMVVMEPHITDQQYDQLPANLRCNFSHGLLCVFMFNTASRSSIDTAIDNILNNIGQLPPGPAFDVDQVVNALKRLLCYKMGLTSFNRLLLCGADLEKRINALFSQIDWEHGAPMSMICEKTVRALNGSLFQSGAGRPGGVVDPAPFCEEAGSVTRLYEMVELYFYVKTYRVFQTYQASDVHIWHLLKLFTNANLSEHPLITRFGDMYDERYATGRVLKAAAEGRACAVGEALVFRYNPQTLIGLRAGGAHVKLCDYPTLTQGQLALAGISLNDVACKEAMSAAVLTLQGKAFERDVSQIDINPHLTPVQLAVRAMGDDTLQHTVMTVINNMLFKHHNNHSIVSARNAYGVTGELLSKTGYRPLAAFTLNPRRSKRPSYVNLCGPDHSAVHAASSLLFYDLFSRSFDVKRLTQACVTFYYIIGNMAPRWRTGRLMLVNYTGPGQGKTFVNDVLGHLFKRFDHLLDQIMGVTPTAFKYTTEPHVVKVKIFDDTGFSAEALKSAKNENYNFAGSFKTMLDNCYMKTEVTERETGVGGRLVTQKRIAVHNCGFVWNTNSLNIFSEAVRDRTVVLGSEPVSAFSVCPGSLGAVCDARGLTELATRCAARQLYFQTAVYLVYPGLFDAEEIHDRVYERARQVFMRLFPTVCDNTKGRGRNATFDMAFDRAAFLTCMKVCDLWIPPWTPLRRPLEGESLGDYSRDVNERRLRMTRALRPLDFVLECAMVYPEMAVGCVTEAVSITLQQSMLDYMNALKEILKAALTVGDVAAERQHMLVHLPNLSGKQLGVYHRLKNVKIPLNDAVPYSAVVDIKQSSTQRDHHTVIIHAEVFLEAVKYFFPDEMTAFWEWLAAQLEPALTEPPIVIYGVLLKALTCRKVKYGVEYEAITRCLVAGRRSGLRLLRYRLGVTEFKEGDALDSTIEEDAAFGGDRVMTDGVLCEGFGDLKFWKTTMTVFDRDLMLEHLQQAGDCLGVKSLQTFDGDRLSVKSVVPAPVIVEWIKEARLRPLLKFKMSPERAREEIKKHFDSEMSFDATGAGLLDYKTPTEGRWALPAVTAAAGLLKNHSTWVEDPAAEPRMWTRAFSQAARFYNRGGGGEEEENVNDNSVQQRRQNTPNVYFSKRARFEPEERGEESSSFSDSASASSGGDRERHQQQKQQQPEQPRGEFDNLYHLWLDP
ncbi:protein Allo56 [Lake sturgeon herpesvirus]|nr:protein Allo56 [Lake sturgeon herpesvirus]